MEEELVEILTKKQYKITTAESCTGDWWQRLL